MKTKLFAGLVKGTYTMEDVKECTPDELRQLLKSAASVINRSVDEQKVEVAETLRQQIARYLKEVEGTPEAAVWHTAKPEDLTIEDINRALKSAQWYKHTYGPAAQLKWKAIVAKGNAHPMYTKAAHKLEQAPGLYAKALADEEYFQNIKSNHKGVSAEDKLKEIRTMVAALEAKPKRSKAEETQLAVLKSIIG